MSVRRDEYEEVVSRINRKYENSIHKGDTFEPVQGISTGSPEMDAAMGGFGVPIGRWTRFYGAYSSTKTLTAFAVIAEAQKLGLSCAYYNVEKQYVPDFVAERGVDISKLDVVEGTSVEEIGEQMESLLAVTHVHVIDSCSIAVSEDELNADIRDWRPGISARAWGKVFRRLNKHFDPIDNTAILIDQVRTSFRAGGGEQPAGGRIFDHQSSMSVMFRKGSWLHRNDAGYLDDTSRAKQHKGMSGQVDPAGQIITARVEKSRVCRPLRSATMWWDIERKKFDRSYEFLKAAKYLDLIEVKGGGNYYYDGERIARGEPEMRQLLDDDEAFREEIMTELREAAQR
jgi:recombination protein RecA